MRYKNSYRQAWCDYFATLQESLFLLQQFIGVVRIYSAIFNTRENIACPRGCSIGTLKWLWMMYFFLYVCYCAMICSIGRNIDVLRDAKIIIASLKATLLFDLKLWYIIKIFCSLTPNDFIPIERYTDARLHPLIFF